jgi:DNA polymerase-3 subunit gamma/tau
MSYQVLARKWRPKSFQEMVGQEHVLRMLINALDNQRLHHAYLFTGTRGVGKTTLARILSKCLNCEKGISSTPCGTCNACQSIDAGRFLDLIEIDAASRTKVEDTREILDNVQYAPSSGRFKIYLIDEVHMLSGHSFNALLKTLEEPPQHVKFLLATTDPKRLPITILSRCLQFNLKRVPVEQISQQLQHICQTENISAETPALQLVAQGADGSMRDALSLLDQTIAFCGEKITTADTRNMLGSIEQDAIFRVLHTLADQNGNQLLTEIAALTEHAPDFSQVLEDMLSILHRTNIAQLIPDFAEQDDAIKNLATKFSAEEVQLYYQIALIGRRDLPLTPNPAHGFEMVMLRMLAFHPATTTEVKTPPPAKPEKKIEKKEITVAAQPAVRSNNWAEILSKLELAGLAQALAANCTLTQLTDDKVELALAKNHESMLNKKMSDRIEQELSKYFGNPMKLDIKITTNEIQTPAKEQKQAQETKHASALDAIKNDTHVKKIMDIFDATLDLASIKAIDSV